jgi:2'-5' RNA ligase
MASPSSVAILRRVREALAAQGPHAEKMNAAGKYLPIHGVTAVMAVEQTWLDSIGAQLWRRLSSEDQVTRAASLMSLKSWHVTLKGLEWAIEHEGVDADVLRRADEIMRGARNHAGRIAMDITAAGNFRTALVLRVRCVEEETETSLRAVEAAVVDELATAMPRSAQRPTTPQEWHLSMGYWRSHATADERRAAEAAALAAFRELGDGRNSRWGCALPLEVPKVCYYESMELFVPLFD